MKVELKLTVRQFLYLSAAFSAFCDHRRSEFNTLPGQEKAILSISQDVADKLYPKAMNLSRKPANASKTKKGKPKLISLTMKYHEARAIMVYMLQAKDKEPDEYLRALANNIYSEVDPKLL